MATLINIRQKMKELAADMRNVADWIENELDYHNDVYLEIAFGMERRMIGTRWGQLKDKLGVPKVDDDE